MPTIRFLIYGYVPSLAWNATFLALFSASLLVHLYQATRSRYWILYPTLCLGALIEVMGYAARVWSHVKVYELNGFLMQICLLIMAPVFFSAYCYVVLGTAIKRLGERYSVIPSKLYFIIFILADIVSLILQAVGGGQAASGAARSAPTQSATNIMVAGIIFQLVAMGVFITCGVDFAMRVVRNRPYSFRLRQIAAAEQRAAEQGSSGSELSDAEKNAAVAPVDSAGASASGVSTPAGLDKPAPTSMQQGQGFSGMDKSERRKWALVLTSVLISSTMILTRGVFRSVELSAGWGGHLVETEIYQMVLDGIPMTIAVGIFNFLHPGLILGKKASWKGYY